MNQPLTEALTKKRKPTWFVKAYVLDSDKPRIAAVFATKKDAVEALENAFGKNGTQLSKYVWRDSLGQTFFLTKG